MSATITKTITAPDHLTAAATAATLGTTGNGWEVAVRASPDYHTLLCWVPRFTSLQFAKVLKDKGSGTIVLDLDDTAFWSQTLGNGHLASDDTNGLLAGEHLWQVYQDGVCVFEFLAETITEQLVDSSEQRLVTITGPGTIAALGWAAAMPPGFPHIVFKTDAIQDGFAEIDVNGNLTVDTSLWNHISPTADVSLNPAGTLQLVATSGTTYCGASPYDITSSSISAQVSPIYDASGAAGLNGSQLSQFYVQDPNQSGNYAMIALSSNMFYCKVGDTVLGSATTRQLPAYDPNSHLYWRISEKSGSFIFWTSADGVSWVKHWTCPYGWDAANIDFYLAAKYSVSGAASMSITNLNADIITPSSAGNIFISQSIMSVWRQLFDAAQARGTIPFVTTRMTKDHDSFGNPWPDSVSVQIQNGTDLYSLLQSHAAIDNCDWLMQPGFLLEVGLPTSNGVTLGQDRSRSIILRENQQQVTKQRVRARDKIANLLGGVNSDGTVVTDSDSSSITQWGQREGWIQTATQVNPSSMATATAASLAETKDEQLSWTLSVLPDKPGAVVFQDYNVGDWVGAERPGGASTVDAVRVVGLAISISATGQVTCETTLNSYRQWYAEQLDYLVQKMGGQFINSLGTTPVTSTAVSPQLLPTLQAPGLGGLSDVTTGTLNMDPLVYNSLTGIWQPASVVDALSGKPLGITLGVPGGASITISPDGSSINLVITDSSGSTRTIVGTQQDGTVTTTDYNAPAPLAPSTPTVGSGILGLYVGWDGNMADGSAPLSDWLYTEVHCSSTSGFTPSAATLQGHIPRGGLFGIGSLSAGTTYYVQLVAVNTSRVPGPASVQGSGVPTSVPANISAGTITGSMIQTGAITSTQIAANAGILGSQLAANAGIVAGQVSFTASEIGGTDVVISSTAPASPTTNELWYDGSNGYVLKQWNGSAWVPYQYGTGAIAAGSITAALIAAGTITATQIAAGTITASQIAAATITGSNIAAGTITASNIEAGTITAALLAAGIVVAGIVDATTITGSTLQNSTTNPKTSINADGSVSITDAHGVLVWKVFPDGTMNWFNSAGQLQMAVSPTGDTLLYASERGPSAWSFETGTDSFAGDHATTPTQDSTWSTDGVYSLLVTSDGTGSAASPWGTTGPQFPVQANEYMNAHCDVQANAALAAVDIGLSFYDSGGAFISTTMTGTTVAMTNGEQLSFSLTGAQAPASAATAEFTITDAEASASGVSFNVDNINIPGGLAYSNSPTGGTDTYGNPYPQGITFYGLAGLESSFTVEDDLGNVLANIDGQGNISGQTVSATDDVYVTGQSLINDILPPLSQGVVAYADATTSLGSNGSASFGTTEGVLYELDCSITAGRLYEVELQNWQANLSASPGRVFINVRYTTDGTTPTTSSALLTEIFGEATSISSFSLPMTAVCLYVAPVTGTLRMIATVKARSGTATVVQNAGSAAFNAALIVRDAGVDPGNTINWINTPAGTSGGSSKTTYTRTWTATHTYSYSGSDGHYPNSRLDSGGRCYQGGSYSSTYNGHCKTWAVFDHSTISSALSGATINWTKVYLNNNHTWYNNGGYAAVGWDTKTSFGSTASDPSGSNIDNHEEWFNEGQAKWFTVGGLGTAFQNGSAYNVVLYKGTGNLNYYGYWAGSSQSGPPQLQINYTK